MTQERIEQIERQIENLLMCDRVYTDPYKKQEMDDLKYELWELRNARD